MDLGAIARHKLSVLQVCAGWKGMKAYDSVMAGNEVDQMGVVTETSADIEAVFTLSNRIRRCSDSPEFLAVIREIDTRLSKFQGDQTLPVNPQC